MTDIDQYRMMLGGQYGAREIVDDSIAKNETKNPNDHWTGIVVDNNDPKQLGRCRIRVIGFYENVADDFLPWAVPEFTYMGSTKGGMIIPPNGAAVRGYFDQGDVQRPIYDGLAFNNYNTENDLSNRRVDYPFKMVLLETDDGDFLTLNRRDGSMLFTHRTGTMFQIDKDGNVSIQTGTQSESYLEVNINGKCIINSKGDINVNSDGNVDVQCGISGQITMGNNAAKQNVNNVPNCFVCGALHSIGNTQVKV